MVTSHRFFFWGGPKALHGLVSLVHFLNTTGASPKVVYANKMTLTHVKILTSVRQVSSLLHDFHGPKDHRIFRARQHDQLAGRQGGQGGQGRRRRPGIWSQGRLQAT